MRFETSQNLKLSQQMKLAPRMIQSMEILQMPILKLQERIEQELESNIALEQVEQRDDGEYSDGATTDVDTDDRADERELIVGDNNETSSDDFARLSEFESSYSEAFDSDTVGPRYSASRQAGERDKRMDAMANIAARGESLTEQLLHQWSFVDVEPDIAEVGRRIIPYIGADGLFTADVATMLEQNRQVPGVDMSEELLNETITHLQRHLDPPGVAALSIQDCLLLQVEAHEADPEDEHEWSDVRHLIRDHLDDLVQNRIPRIEQATGLSHEQIQDARALMRKLDLSPARNLVDESVPPIIPDVYIEYDDELDEYIASLSDAVLPHLRVSQRYANMARDRNTDKETREYLNQNVRNATWLIDFINQRENTLLRVVKVVLARQRDYFDYGPQHLKPLPMIDVADLLGIHVGTVSRAVADKWVQTPKGVEPLRKFFSGGTATDAGKDMSWEAVKATLKEIIDEEDKSRPLSDESLAAELKKRGIEIARRTVVKYRSQLDIPPARRRKVFD